MCNRKADAFITLAVDVVADKTLVTAYLRRHTDPEVQVRSFSCLIADADLLARLPEWLAEMRAEALLGGPESIAERDARIGNQSSCSGGTESASLNSICTSLGPATGPRSFTR